jgi:hypothetical protein
MENKKEKTRYSDEELQEFKAIILKKLEEARSGLKISLRPTQPKMPTIPTIHPLRSRSLKRARRYYRKKKTASWQPGSRSSSGIWKMPLSV